MKPLYFHPDALAELHVAPLYHHDSARDDLAEALVGELNHALDQIATYPHRWKAIAGNVHSFGPTKRFKWRISYIEHADKIVIAAAYYSGIEDPLYWLERLND